MGPKDVEVLDRTALLERLGGDLALFQEIAGLFREDCPKMLSEIRSAVDGVNPAALERAAHTLKGCVANFGAQAAVQAALNLEKMGRSRQIDAAPGACETLEAEIVRFQEALDALARELARP
jgi:HPt (histidine-containing phosphotransfer) domain-containing protein